MIVCRYNDGVILWQGAINPTDYRYYLKTVECPDGLIPLMELRRITGINIAPDEPGEITVWMEE